MQKIEIREDLGGIKRSGFVTIEQPLPQAVMAAIYKSFRDLPSYYQVKVVDSSD